MLHQEITMSIQSLAISLIILKGLHAKSMANSPKQDCKRKSRAAKQGILFN
jgi:hypothetical protein